MKFSMYIIDLDEATIHGTNDVEVAEEFVKSDHHLILHSEGSYFAGTRQDIEVRDINEVDKVVDSEEEEN